MHAEVRYYIRPGVIEVEQVHTSMLGNHNSRNGRMNLTAEAVKKINAKRVAKNLRRLIDANFIPGDMYITLTYKEGTHKTLEEVDNDLSCLVRKLKYRYRKRGSPLKWIAVTGIESPHIHIIINTLDDMNYLKEIPAIWKQGFIDIKPLYIEGRYERLAAYLAKHKEENEKKLGISLKDRKAYRNSRNLKRPRVKRIRINERMIIRKPKVPTGYRIEGLEEGISRETGYHYRYFMLIKTERKRE